MAAYATRSGRPIISAVGADGKRRFSIAWYAANFNDANTFCSNARGGPVAELSDVMKKDSRCVIDKVTVWHDATTAGFNETYHYMTMYFSQSTTTAPLSFSKSWYCGALLDVEVCDVQWPVDPFSANVLMLYSANYSATDDLFIIVEGYIDG